MDELLNADLLSKETVEYFLQLKRRLELDEDYQDFLKAKREKLVRQALQLGLLDSLESDFLETETISDLIHDFEYYLANPAE